MRLSCCFALTLLSGALIAAAQQSDPTQAPPNEAAYREWTIMRVPGTWDENSSGELSAYDGFAWYRCEITMPGGWNKGEVELLVSQIDNAHEAYFNGTKVGGAGSFPPEYKSGLAAENAYKIPSELIKPGANIVSLRVYDNDGRGGFKSIAPVLKRGAQAIALNGHWEFRLGDDLEWAKGPLKRTNAGVFWRVMSAEEAIANATGSEPPLSPVESLKTFTIPDDLALDQLLAEPHVTQPLFLDFDERGRLWVMEYRQYPDPAGLKMVSRDDFWRSVYDKIPEPPPNHTKGADRISIHEDTDGDGTYDSHKTFLEGLSIASSFARGRGGVFVLNPPYLLFYPDRDNDDVPDGDPEVLLRGFGMEDTHSVANSLRWGPDGWLYAAQGSTVSGNISKLGEEKKAVHSMGQLIWRYHPEKRIYEIFAEGGGNTFGVEIDSKGRIYSGHNGGDTRGFHYVQGAYYRKGFGKHGPLSNPYSFGYFEHIKHHSVPRFTHNFIIYEDPALPKRYHGKLFGIEPLQGQVVQSNFQPLGSSFQTEDINRPITSTDRRFRPVDIKLGPDGAIYVADLYEPQISHREHFAGQIDKRNGRVYRLKARGQAPLEPFDLSKLTSAELVEKLKHPNKWFRQQALRLLGDRKDDSIIPALRLQIESGPGQDSLEALWALYQTGGLTESYAGKLLGHVDPFVRLWTARLLCDEKQVSAALAYKLAEMARIETNVEVRVQLACSAKRLPADAALPVVVNLLRHEEDASDLFMPLLLWWALEDKAGTDPAEVVNLFEDDFFWKNKFVAGTLIERMMQRFAQSGTRNELLLCAKLLELAPDKASSEKLMAGFEAAYKGRSLAGLPAELTTALTKAGGGSLALRIRQNDEKAIAEGLQMIADPKADTFKRTELVQTFGEVSVPDSVPVLLQLLASEAEAKNDSLLAAVLTALQTHSRPEIGAAVVKRYPTLSKETQPVAQTLLSSRKAWSRQLLEAIDAGSIDKETLPLDLVRKMTIHSDDRIAALIEQHWDNLGGASSADMQALIQKLSKEINSDSSDPYRGRVLFKESCGKCHLLYGEGGRIGPDLTSFKRDDTLNMLINVVNPSAEIREGFETMSVITDDGRVLTGFLADQDNRVIVLRGVDGQNITIERDSIEDMVRQKKSLMPEGLLDKLDVQQVRDLFAYLRGSQPLNR